MRSGGGRDAQSVEGEPLLLLGLDQRKEDRACRHDDEAVMERHRLGPEHVLQRRKICDGELGGGDGENAGPYDRGAPRRSLGERSAVDVADEEEVEDLEHHQRVHGDGRGKRYGITAADGVEVQPEDSHHDQD